MRFQFQFSLSSAVVVSICSMLALVLRADDPPPFALEYREWQIGRAAPAQAALAGYDAKKKSFFLVNPKGVGLEVGYDSLSRADRGYVSSVLYPYRGRGRYGLQMPWGRAFLFENQLSTRPMHLYAGGAARTPVKYVLEDVAFVDDARWGKFAGCLATALTMSNVPDAWRHFERAFDKVRDHEFRSLNAAKQLQLQGIHFTMAPNTLGQEQGRLRGEYLQIEYDPAVYIDGIRWFIGYQKTPVVCYFGQTQQSRLLIGYDMIKEDLYYVDDAFTKTPQRMSFKEYVNSKPEVFGFYRENSRGEIASWSEQQRRRNALSLMATANPKNMRVLAEQIYREGGDVSYVDYNAGGHRSQGETRSYARQQGLNRVMLSLKSDYVAILPYYDGGMMHAVAIVGYDAATHDFRCVCLSGVSGAVTQKTLSKGQLVSNWLAQSSLGWHLEVVEVRLN